MEYEEFVARQNSIYRTISSESDKLLKEGVSPNQKILNGEKGYIIGYNHPIKISKKIEEISKDIASFMPSMLYTTRNIHTTIFSQKIDLDAEFKTSYMDKLSSSVENSSLLRPEIEYKHLLYNQNSVIAPGQPNVYFFDTCLNINKELQKSGIECSMPKMSHITVARFLDNTTQDNINEFVRYVQNLKPLGISMPFTIFIGTFETSRSGFELDLHKQIKI